MTKHKQVVVIGGIGSGKTTACHALASILNLPLVDADLFEQNPFLSDYVKDNKRWAFTNELYFILSRIKKLANLSLLLANSNIVVDSGLIMSLEIYTKLHASSGTLTPAEWDFFKNIVRDYRVAIPEPNIVVMLKAPPNVQLERIKSRDRDFEANYTLDYLTAVSKELDNYAAHIRNSATKLIQFDTVANDLSRPSARTKLAKLVKTALVE